MLRNRNRRRIVFAAALASALLTDQATAQRPEANTLRIGTTPVFLDDQVGLLDEWRSYLEKALGRPVRFVQRRSYREITDLLLREELEAAWICGYPYVINSSRLDLCAVPVYRGAPLYQSYLVVPENDRSTKRIEDLGGKVFAYSDPQSNSGYLVPFSELVRDRIDPTTFFKRTFFTFAHKRVVEAVSVGLAQGGAVDGYIFDTMRVQLPDSVSRVHVAWRSPSHGFPPIVTRRSLPAAEATQLRSELLGMRDSVEGKAILLKLNIDGFMQAGPELFASIEKLVRESGVARV